MIVKIDPEGLKQTKWSEYGVRFLLGGLITVGAGIIAKQQGPVVGGLFLAFPAIFPASVTLIEKHERDSDGEKCALDDAAADAAGTALGSIGLMAFALAVWALIPSLSPVLTIICATVAWLFGSAIAWVASEKLPWKKWIGR
jgi:uncharacterized membrane protein (GlpM family)